MAHSRQSTARWRRWVRAHGRRVRARVGRGSVPRGTLPGATRRAGTDAERPGPRRGGVIRAAGVRWGPLLLAVGVTLAAVLITLVAHPVAVAQDSRGTDIFTANAPQITGGSGSLADRWPIFRYELDQTIPGGVTHIGNVPALLAYIVVSFVWSIAMLVSYIVVLVFRLAFGLDIINGSGGHGGVLHAIGGGIQGVYHNSNFQQVFIAMVLGLGLWMIWQLARRDYTQTVGGLLKTLAIMALATGIVLNPSGTIGQATSMVDGLSGAVLAMTQGKGTHGQSGRTAAENELFTLTISEPWRVLDFGGLKTCTTQGGDHHAVSCWRPGGGQRVWSRATSVYADHFLRFPVGSQGRQHAYEALNTGENAKFDSHDPKPARDVPRLDAHDGAAVDVQEPAGQFQRLPAALLILVGDLGAALVVGGMSAGTVLAKVMVLFLVGISPFALLLGVIPGRGHEFFVGWGRKLFSALVRKLVYATILTLILFVERALSAAGSLASSSGALGWFLAYLLQVGFFWLVVIKRNDLREGFGKAMGAEGVPPGRGLRAVMAETYMASRLLHPAGRGGRKARGSGRGGTGGGDGGGSGSGSGGGGGGGGGGMTMPETAPDATDGEHEGRDRVNGAAASSRPNVAEYETVKGAKSGVEEDVGADPGSGATPAPGQAHHGEDAPRGPAVAVGEEHGAKRSGAAAPQGRGAPEARGSSSRPATPMPPGGAPPASPARPGARDGAHAEPPSASSFASPGRASDGESEERSARGRSAEAEVARNRLRRARAAAAENDGSAGPPVPRAGGERDRAPQRPGGPDGPQTRNAPRPRAGAPREPSAPDAGTHAKPPAPPAGGERERTTAPNPGEAGPGRPVPRRRS